MCIFAVVSYNKTRWKKIRRPKLHTLRNSIMTRKQAIKLFQEKRIRTVWDDEQEKWYFCVADMVEALTDSVNPTDYIKKMKKRDPELAKGWGQIVTPLSVQTAGGKQRVNCATPRATSSRLRWPKKAAVWQKQLANNLKANWGVLSYLSLRPATTCCQITRKRRNKDMIMKKEITIIKS